MRPHLNYWHRKGNGRSSHSLVRYHVIASLQATLGQLYQYFESSDYNIPSQLLRPRDRVNQIE